MYVACALTHLDLAFNGTPRASWAGVQLIVSGGHCVVLCAKKSFRLIQRFFMVLFHFKHGLSSK